jgi:hypothetical protein
MEAFSGRELSALMTACVHIGKPPPRAFLVAWMHELRRRMEAMEAAADAVSTPTAAAKRPVGFGTRQAATSSSSSSSSRSRSPSAAPEDDSPVSAPSLPHMSAPTLAASDPSQAEPQVGGVLEEHQQGVSTASSQQEEGREAVQGASQPAILSGSVLAVCGWALAKLSLKPKPQWLGLYQRAVVRCTSPALSQQGGVAPLSPLEFTLATWALGAWEAEVSMPSVCS